MKKWNEQRKLLKNLLSKKGKNYNKFVICDVLLLACVFENVIKVSINEFGINPIYCVSLPGCTWQYGLKYTGINLQTLQVKNMILPLENNICGGISSVMGDRYVKSDEKESYFLWMILFYMDNL